jgi:hypothetical protein
MAEEQEVHLTSQIIAGNPKREIVELAKNVRLSQAFFCAYFTTITLQGA